MRTTSPAACWLPEHGQSPSWGSRGPAITARAARCQMATRRLLLTGRGRRAELRQASRSCQHNHPR